MRAKPSYSHFFKHMHPASCFLSSFAHVSSDAGHLFVQRLNLRLQLGYRPRHRHQGRHVLHGKGLHFSVGDPPFPLPRLQLLRRRHVRDAAQSGPRMGGGTHGAFRPLAMTHSFFRRFWLIVLRG